MIDLKHVSLKWKTAAPIIIFVTLGVLITIFVTGYRTRDIVLQQEKRSTLHGYRDTVINALTTMMISGNFRPQEAGFIGEMKNIMDLRIVRGDSVKGQFGEGNGGAYIPDKAEREVLDSGKEKVIMEGDYLRGVYPFLAGTNYMGRNCLSCHNVKEGDVLGVVSIKIPLAASFARIRGLQRLYAFLGIIGICCIAWLVIFIVNFTHRPLTDLIKNMKIVTHEHSALELWEEGSDEVAQVAQNVSQIIRFFNEMVSRIMISTSKILPVIDSLKEKTEKTAVGAKEQSAQAEQIATAAEEMNQTISMIAKAITGAAGASDEAMDIAVGGKEVASGAVETVDNVSESTVRLSGIVEKLNLSVEEIGGIVTVIKDIADQTNLLALNAAIEAARAGEQGRGFAVVADEVRKLAAKTIRATSEISGKISSVQEESTETVNSMKGATAEVSKATQYIKSVGQALESIVGAVRKVSDQMAHISAAIEEQSATTIEVSRHIEDTASISHGIETLSMEGLNEVLRLSNIAEELREAASGVKTKGGAIVMIEIAKNDHKNFVEKIASCVSGKRSMNASQLPDHHSCRFGKWYYREGHDLCGGMNSYRQVESPHEKIHRLAKEALTLTGAGNKDRAENVFKEMESVSRHMIGLLDNLKSECA